ncbi:MAG: AraC family transcriptional regulator [Clostridia bacterium]|nr:AraC family transcriptional regulator [Clostridia bacterium]
MKQNVQRTVAKLHSAISIVKIDTRTDVFPHDHDYYEFAVTVEDGYYHVVNGERVDVTVGDVVLLRPSDIHSLHPTRPNGRKCINILIPIDLFEDVCDQLSSTLLDRITMMPAPVIFNMGKAGVKGLEQRYSFERKYFPDPESWKIDSLNKFYTIRKCTAYEWIGRIVESGIVDGSIAYSTCIQKIVDLLSDPENLKLPVGTIIKKSYFSSSYISHQFKNQFGIKFEDYIAICRVKEAEKLLLNTDMSMDKISREVGWKSTSSFINKFKELYGVTPAKFRRTKLKQDPSEISN